MLVVRVVVMVEAGDSKDSGMTSAPPITMRTASVSPKARVMPRMTAVMREGIADLITTWRMVCQRVYPSASEP
ncbi:Uncharacterised protein [Collinsella intestinalis]|nr:Uncharacterised protein [Collinsella intestinalis]